MKQQCWRRNNGRRKQPNIWFCKKKHFILILLAIPNASLLRLINVKCMPIWNKEKKHV